MPPLADEQLDAEARALHEDMAAPPGGTAEADGARADASAGTAEAGGEDLNQEHIPNPGPGIAATLKRARQLGIVQRLVSPKVLAVFDDTTCDELGEALGDLTVKHGEA